MKLLPLKLLGFKNKILSSLLLTGLLPALVVTLFALNRAGESISDQTFRQLESVRESKKDSVTNYLQSASQQIASLSRSDTVRTGIVRLNEAFNAPQFETASVDANSELEPRSGLSEREDIKEYYQQTFLPKLNEVEPDHSVDVGSLVKTLSLNALLLQNSYIRDNPHPVGKKHLLDASSSAGSYDRVHQQVHPFLRDYLERFGYYDIFLVNPQGEVIYSVYKEVDFATSLESGPYVDSGLAEAFRSGQKAGESQAAVFIDFKRYLPSFNAPAGFIAKPVFADGERLGSLIFQFPIDNLNAIMGQRAGLGETGESYLVGPDQLMRSDSYLSPETHSVKGSFRNPETGAVNTDASRLAAKGQSGAKIIQDYNGNPVLSAFGPLGFDGLDWSILVEIDEAEAMAKVDSLSTILMVTMGICFVVIVAIALYLSTAVTKPLGGEPEKIQEITKSIADGDLSIHLEPSRSKNCMYSSIFDMAANLKAMVSKIDLAASSQASASEQLSAVTNQTSGNIDKQNKKTLAVATSVQQMSASVMEVSQTTEATAEAANDARIQVNASVNDVISASDNVKRMAESLNGGREKIELLQESTDSIADILQTITGIADQTNLLALNAAIEAARAGEHGRGFAVVSEEVRNLAGHTQEATEQISKVIAGLISAASDASKVMDSSADLALTISEESTATASRLKEAAHSVDRIAEMTGQIASASNEQASVAEEVSTQIAEINAMSLESGGSIGQISTASDELASLSVELRGLVHQFKS